MVCPVEAELQKVGRSIHAAFPGPTRHPLKALDTKAMGMAAQDQQLRAISIALMSSALSGWRVGPGKAAWIERPTLCSSASTGQTICCRQCPS